MEWISVKDRLPKEYEPVLVTYKSSSSVGRKWCSDGLATIDKCKIWHWWDSGDIGDEVDEENKITHWMPLPEPPKEQENETI